MRKYIFILFTLSFTVATYAQSEARFQKIDSLLSYLTANDKFMGSVSIRVKDKVVFDGAYGYANVATNTKADTETKYKIGSITKMFTSAIIFQLIEDKKLKMDTKLSEFFPDIKNAENITIKNLLNHTSGIFNYTNDESFLAYMEAAQTREAMAKRIADFGSSFTTNEKADYSNSNYILLGYIIEDVTKKTYKDVVAQRIVKKLKLKNTYYYGKINPNKNEAYSYDFNGNTWEQRGEWHESVAFAAGALQSTPNDLTQFIRALFEGDIIKESSLEEMKKMDFGYGKGIFIFPFGERRFYGHTGGIEGFSSTLGYYPKDELSVAMTINGENYDSNQILIGILSIYYKIPYAFPNLKTATVDPEILKSYEGTYASPTIPLKITIQYNGSQLTAQATGQGAFPLNPLSNTEFNFDPAGIVITFRENGFVIKQGGTTNNFTKE
ncbi:serine hydrolase domain-containing protein [Flavobacterium litorale]|uniref:Beta-lactamase family protein n=1 Tax=Flavobacterium litorale TaxID=2856519 RepID=A0ABX8VDX0_9FLAO|nr:serine hydrolase domain-containing protein [Flavobacterium litorale]QYJ69358.1 beta-lactamase family protein [Flavobacterium litorale]